MWNGTSHRDVQPLKLKYTLNVLQIDVCSTGSHWWQRKIVEIWCMCQNNSISCAAIEKVQRQCACHLMCIIVCGIVRSWWCAALCLAKQRRLRLVWIEYSEWLTDWLNQVGRYRAARAAKKKKQKYWKKQKIGHKAIAQTFRKTGIHKRKSSSTKEMQTLWKTAG